jgi:hypothetical protein
MGELGFESRRWQNVYLFYKTLKFHFIYNLSCICLRRIFYQPRVDNVKVKVRKKLSYYRPAQDLTAAKE